MTIYIVNFNDQPNYAAYLSEQKAKQVLWDAYYDDFSADIREQCAEEDKATLAKGYIIDYGWVDTVDLYDDNGDEVHI